MAKRNRSRKSATDPTCRQATELIADYLSDRLDPVVKRKFERHLSICPDCVNFLNTYKKTVAAAGSLRVRALPVGLRNNVLSFLRKKMRPLGAVLLILAHQWLH